MQYGGMALGLLQACLWVLFLSGPLFYRLRDSFYLPPTILLVFLLAHSTTYLLIGLTWRNLREKTVRFLSVIAPVFLSAGIIGVSQCQGASFWFFLVISGISLAVLICITGILFIEMENHNRAILAYGLAITIGTLLFFICDFISVGRAVLLLAICPWMILYILRRNSPEKYSSTPGLPPALFKLQSLPFSKKFVLLLLLYYVAGGMMYRIIFLLPRIPMREIYYYTNAIYCLIGLLAAVLLYMQKIPRKDFIFMPVLPLLGIGFLLFPYMNHAGYFVSFGLLQAGFALFDLYVWLVLVEMGKERYGGGIFGWGFFLVTCSILMGSLLYEVVVPFAAANISHIHALSILAALMMFIASIFVFSPLTHKPVSREEEEAGLICDIEPLPAPALDEMAGLNRQTAGPATTSIPIKTDDNDEQLLVEQVGLSSCLDQKEITETLQSPPDGSIEKDRPDYKEEFMKTHKLTKREREIVLLIVKGYNNPHMCEELNISVNTLKTHLRNIYRKIGVEDRQELINKYYS